MYSAIGCLLLVKPGGYDWQHNLASRFATNVQPERIGTRHAINEQNP